MAKKTREEKIHKPITLLKFRHMIQTNLISLKKHMHLEITNTANHTQYELNK